jgi:hypothetical protein
MGQIEFHLITQAQQQSIQTILEAGVLEIKGGSVTIHFDNLGKIRLIQRNDDIYRANRQVVDKQNNVV